jgi:hypothetical protein
LFLLAAALAACGDRDSAADRAPSPSTSAPLRSAEEVTLSGRVTVTYGPHLFAVGSGREQVTVVVAGPAPVTVGDEVEVSGRVRTCRRGELEAELGVALGPRLDELKNDSCLVAATTQLR